MSAYDDSDDDQQIFDINDLMDSDEEETENKPWKVEKKPWEISDSDENEDKDTLKSENKKIVIKGFAQNRFAFTLQPIVTSNHWEKILLS